MVYILNITNSFFISWGHRVISTNTNDNLLNLVWWFSFYLYTKWSHISLFYNSAYTFYTSVSLSSSWKLMSLPQAHDYHLLHSNLSQQALDEGHPTSRVTSMTFDSYFPDNSQNILAFFMCSRYTHLLLNWHCIIIWMYKNINNIIDWPHRSNLNGKLHKKWSLCTKGESLGI